MTTNSAAAVEAYRFTDRASVLRTDAVIAPLPR